MIELRWLTRPIDYTGINQGHMPDDETVLQYREGSYGYGDDFASDNAAPIFIGTDWRDVPKARANSTTTEDMK